MGKMMKGRGVKLAQKKNRHKILSEQMKTKLLLKKEWRVLVVALVLVWFHFGLADEGKPDYFQDQDQDGLTNAEELSMGTDPNNSDTDGDGYTDGVEVESGYDPLKPAPGDRLIPEAPVAEEAQVAQVKGEATEKVNLTDEFIEKLKEEKADELALLNSDDGKEIDRDDISLTTKDVKTLAERVMDEASLEDDFVLLPEEDFTILDEVKDRKEDKKKEKERKQIEQYLASTGFLLAAGMPFSVDNNESQYFEKKIKDYITGVGVSIEEGNPSEVRRAKNKLNDVLEELKQVETPFVLKDLHIRWVSLLSYLLNQDESVVFEKDDPIAMSLMAGKLQAAINEIKEIEIDFNEIIGEYVNEGEDAGKFRSQQDKREAEEVSLSEGVATQKSAGEEADAEESAEEDTTQTEE